MEENNLFEKLSPIWGNDLFELNKKNFYSNKVSLNQIKICSNQINFCLKSRKFWVIISGPYSQLLKLQIFIWIK